MQCGPIERIIFRPSTYTKRAIENEPVGVFSILFSVMEDRSLTYFPFFVVLYLKMVENIDQVHESSFFSY